MELTEKKWQRAEEIKQQAFQTPRYLMWCELTRLDGMPYDKLCY